MTQKTLSALSGLPQPYISRIEKGEVDVKVSTIINIAKILGLEFRLIPMKWIHAVDAISSNKLDRLDRPTFILDGNQNEDEAEDLDLKEPI